MPSYILRLERGERKWYLEWSTIVDAPITDGMSAEAFADFYLREYGRKGTQSLPSRLDRVEKWGTSAEPGGSLSPEQLIRGNRAGLNETELSKDEIIDAYCLGLPKARGKK